MGEDERELQRRVNEVLARYSKDLREHSAELAKTLDQAPEVRVCLEAVGVCTIRELSPTQMQEMTNIIFTVMNRHTHPGAN